MKNIILISAILISGFVSTSIAQSFPDPEFSSQMYILEVDNTLKNLERTDAQMDIKIKGMGYGGSEIYYTAFTPKSDVRLSKNALPKLVIKVEGNINPSELISLAKAVVKKNSRRFLQSSMAFLGKARDVSSSYVKLEFKKNREGIFEVILPSDIQPGEYAFMPINRSFTSSGIKVKISCFGID